MILWSMVNMLRACGLRKFLELSKECHSIYAIRIIGEGG
jgi:hypothetical protein